MMVLEDKTNSLTIDQISTSKYQKEFKKNYQRILNLSISRSTFWLKIKLVYPDSYPNKEDLKRWYLELGRSNLDMAELFIEEFDGVYEVKSSDMRSAYSDREVQHVNSVFIVDMSIGQEMTLYAKFKSRTAVYMPITLWSQREFVKEVSTVEFIYGVFFGGMLILLSYNLFLYVSVRDVSYLYYVLYLGGISLFDFLEIGHGVIHLTNIIGDINREYVLFIIWETAISGLLFAKSFMSIKENHPRINDFFNLLITCSIISAFITIFTSYDTGAFFNLLFMVVFLPAYLAVIVYCWYKGNQNAKYFFFAWISNIIGLLIFSGVTYKIIPATPFTLSATPIGILVEAVALSFALANRIKNEQAAALFADNQAMSHLEKYQSVFENAREGMYTMTMEGVFLSSNPSMVRIFGFEDAKELKLYGDDLARALFNDNREEYLHLLTRGRSGHDLFFCRRDGSQVWATHNAKLVVDVYGNPHHIEGTVVNDTQSMLKNIAVQEGEKERIEKDIAKASTSAKSEFLSNMSHEIRTPLTAIIGFSESLKDESLTKSERDHAVKLVVSSSHVLLQLINDILDFSKMDAGKLGVESVTVNLIDMVERVRDEYIFLAERKQLTFDIAYQYPLPGILIGDSMRMSQVLKNLCSNAIKFTDKGGVVLSVRWDSRQNKLVFEVIDSGVGMSNEVQHNLFQIFDQADTSSTRQYGGAGLGLAISQKLAVLMGGSITVMSEVGKGSTFAFDVDGQLPPSVDWLQGGGQSKKSASRMSGTVKSTPKLTGTVLLAEDNVVNQKLIERVLKKIGVNVIIAADGVEACEACDKALPDFVLMDINMPRRNGIEAVKYIRGRGYQVPIYALTAEVDQVEIDKVLAAGCQGLLAKPLNKRKLFEVLDELMPHCDSSITDGIFTSKDISGPRNERLDMSLFVQDLPRLEELMIELVMRKNWTKLKSIVKKVHKMALSLDLNTLVQHSEGLTGILKNEVTHETAKDVDRWLSMIIEDFGFVVENIEEKR
ncbi:hypothetical protein A9Q81_01905 [Gammaproteobacteria bacterium 42_54_T18]|nr:hypothetical protein A9Q81_01905 [Gammaproteobacteria bacterium 42_54_T18]